MSSTIIFGFNKKGNSEEIAEVKNAWLGAFAVWEHLTQKYLKKSMSLSNGKETWNLIDDDRLNKVEKIVLLSTFDNVIIRKEEIPELIKAYREFEYKQTTLKEQSIILEILLKERKDIEYIGFHQNSISCSMWNNCNLFKVKHYFLFDDSTIKGSDKK